MELAEESEDLEITLLKIRHQPVSAFDKGLNHVGRIGNSGTSDYFRNHRISHDRGKFFDLHFNV